MIFNINQDTVIVIYPNWSLKQTNLNEFIIYRLYKNKWKLMKKFKLDIDSKEFERISIFNMRINSSYLSDYSIIETEIEIDVDKEEEEKNLSFDVKIKRGDDEEPDEDERFIKKKKNNNNNKLIDILFFGLHHDDNEGYLSKNFINSMTKYNPELSSKSKKLCCLWETPPFINNNINMNSIDGDTTLSYQIRLESSLLGGFSYLDSAMLTFFFPLNFKEGDTPIINNEFDQQCYTVHETVKIFHGIKYVKNNNNLSIQLSLNFILGIFVGLIDNNNDTEFLSLMFKEHLGQFLQNIRDLMRKIIFKNASKYDDIINRTVDDYEKKLKMNGDKIRSRLFMDTELISSRKEHLIIIKEILDIFDLRELHSDIKNFMFETWSMMISNHSKMVELSDLLNEKIPSPGLLKKPDYHIDYDYSNTIINSHYFTLLFKNEIKDRSTIDISLLMFLLHFNYLKRDGIFMKTDAINKTNNTFVQFRDLFSYTNIYTIVNNTPIDRIILFTGTGHTKHLNELLLTNDNYRTTVYNHYHDIDILNENDYNRLNNDVKELIDMIKLDFHYYLQLEYIDYWLYETDFGKENIDSDTHYDQLDIQFSDSQSFKLNFYTNQRINLKKLLKLVETNHELEDIYMVISIYYGLLLSYYTPVIDHKYTKESESYFNTDSEIKEKLLNEYLYPYISKDNLVIRNYRIIGEPLIKFTYDDDNEEETLEDNGNIKTFIELLMEKMKEGYIINV